MSVIITLILATILGRWWDARPWWRWPLVVLSVIWISRHGWLPDGHIFRY